MAAAATSVATDANTIRLFSEPLPKSESQIGAGGIRAGPDLQ